MNYRKALENPERFIQAHWKSRENCPHERRIDELSKCWQVLKPELKTLQDAKGACSRHIGEVRAAGGDITELKAEMAGISRRLAQIDEERKALESRLAELIPSKEKLTERVPERFCEIADEPVADPVTIVECTDADQSDWDAFVDCHPGASLYHRYGWRRVIETSFSHETRYWGARDREGKMVGVLPAVRLQSRLFGDFAVSLPYFNYGGILSRSASGRSALLQAAADYGAAAGLSHVELRDTAPGTWPSRTDKASMILRLPASGEALDRQIGAKVRAQVRQGASHPHQVSSGGAELLEDFYQVFAANMRDLGTPVYSKAFFANILRVWKDAATIVVVRAPRPVAAAFLLGYKEILEIPWASTLRAANPMNMNMLLYWEVLSLAVQKGYAYFDFGRSSVDAGTYQFKKQWGAEPVQHHWHYWLPADSELPRLSPDNPKYRLAIAIWRKLPLAVTTTVGPHIVKYLP